MTTTEILTGIKDWVLSKLSLKQDVINDLATIRSGAQAGTTAVQPSDLSEYFNDASYDASTHRINFYHGQNIVAYVDASPFIVDGMVDDVRIENGYLVIDFNTDSGKQDISIPLTDIFDPSNYYNKTQTDALLGNKVDKVSGKGLSTNDYTNAEKEKLSGLQNYDDKQVRQLIGQKQDIIQDLEDIRSGASAGATAVQTSTLNSALSDTVAESGVYDVTANNNNAKFASLSALLGSENLDTLIPSAKRKGGMSVKFIKGSAQGSDNKYVQYFLTKDEWSASEGYWEKMNLEEEVSQLGQEIDTTKRTQEGTKNLFDPTYLKSVAGWLEPQVGVFKGNLLSLHDNFSKNDASYPIIADFKPNTRYTLSLEGRNTVSGVSGTGLQCLFVYTDDSTGIAFSIPNSDVDWTAKYAVSAGWRTLKAIRFTYGSNPGIWELRNIQLEEGTAQTSFFPFNQAVDYSARENIQMLVHDMNNKPEINISSLFPTGGIGGTNKYTLTSAIAKIPDTYKVPNITISFFNENDRPVKYRLVNNSFSTNEKLWFECGITYGKFGYSSLTLNINTVSNKIETVNGEFIWFGYGHRVIKPSSAGVLSSNIYASSSSVAIIISNGSEMIPIDYSNPIPDGYCVVAIIGTNYTPDLTQKQFISVIWCGSPIMVNGEYYLPNNNWINEVTGNLKKDINSLSDAIGFYESSFYSNSGEHSTTKDYYPVNIPAETKVYGILNTGTAVMSPDVHTVRVAFSDSQHIEFQRTPINIGEPFEIVVREDASYVSFYIHQIVEAGTFEFVIDTKKIPSLEERVDILEENGVSIPQYFEENVQEAENAAINDIAFAGVNGENFIFITDMHWEHNAKHSPALIKKITNDMCIGNIVFGGDAINGQADQNIARQYFNAIAGGLSSSNSPFVAVFGNHDYNNADGGVGFSNGDKTFLALFQKKNDYRIDNPTYETYFYYDNKASNTRHIILNYATLTSGSAQETWLTTLLNNTPNDMHIILYMHMYINTQGVYEEGSWVGYDFYLDTPAQILNNILEDTTKKVEAIVAGHLHLDYNGCTPGMIPVLLTDCDTRQTMSGSSEEALGTKDEQAFDIVTTDFGNKIITCRRIGRRKSRIIHYNVYTLSVNETLDISTLLSITPTSYSIRDNFNFQYRTNRGITYSSTLASINSVGLVIALSSGVVIAVAENDNCIETFNIKIE